MMHNTKTGKQNMNRSRQTAFVIQNFVSASPMMSIKPELTHIALTFLHSSVHTTVQSPSVV